MRFSEVQRTHLLWMGSNRTVSQQDVHAPFLESHQKWITWLFCTVWSDADNRTVFATCIWGVVNEWNAVWETAIPTLQKFDPSHTSRFSFFSQKKPQKFMTLHPHYMLVAVRIPKQWLHPASTRLLWFSHSVCARARAPVEPHPPPKHISVDSSGNRKKKIICSVYGQPKVYLNKYLVKQSILFNHFSLGNVPVCFFFFF